VAVSLPITSEEVDYLRDLTGRRDVFLMEIDPHAPWATAPLPVIEAAYVREAAHAADFEDLAARADRRLRNEIQVGLDA
jgi:hypothetical protein